MRKLLNILLSQLRKRYSHYSCLDSLLWLFCVSLGNSFGFLARLWFEDYFWGHLMTLIEKSVRPLVWTYHQLPPMIGQKSGLSYYPFSWSWLAIKTTLMEVYLPNFVGSHLRTLSKNTQEVSLGWTYCQIPQFMELWGVWLFSLVTWMTKRCLR